MTDPARIGVIGWGAVAREVVALIRAEPVERIRVVGTLVRRVGADTPEGAVATVADLLAGQPRLVVEAAGHEAVQTVCADVLRAGISVVCTSVGALADESTRATLEAAALEGNSRVIVPSGAVAALDLLRAARARGLTSVQIEQRKPPAVVLPEAEAAVVDAPMTVFSGTAREAARRYPRTMNIVAAVALAGAGLDHTTAVLVADPGVSAAQVNLEARGEFGDLSLHIGHRSSDNPATSIITPWSVVAAVHNEVSVGVVFR